MPNLSILVSIFMINLPSYECSFDVGSLIRAVWLIRGLFLERYSLENLGALELYENLFRKTYSG